MTRWYRAYEGTVTDAKLAEAALVVGCSKSVAIATWHALLENAACVNDGGRIDTPARRVAAILGEPIETIQGLFNAFFEAEMLEGSSIANWKKRQFESDNSTERSAKSRAAAKAREEAAKQQQCNADATLQNKTETSPSVYVSVSDGRVASEKITDEFENWYAVYPRHKGRGAALKAYKAARKKVGADVLLAAARMAAKVYSKLDQNFVPYPASWLNGEQWCDEDLQPPKPPPENASSRVYVKYGSDAGDAWEAHYRTMNKVPPRDQHGGWWFDSENPPPIVQRGTSDAILPPATSEAA